MATTQPKFTITIDMPLVLKRHSANRDAVKEVVTAIRDWCDFTERRGFTGLSGNIIADRKSVPVIVGKAHLPRTRTAR